jgi:hypothetical protein
METIVHKFIDISNAYSNVRLILLEISANTARLVEARRAVKASFVIRQWFQALGERANLNYHAT